MGYERDGVVAGVSENSMEKTGRRLRSEWQRIGIRARLLGGRAAESVCAACVHHGFLADPFPGFLLQQVQLSPCLFYLLLVFLLGFTIVGPFLFSVCILPISQKGAIPQFVHSKHQLQGNFCSVVHGAQVRISQRHSKI